MNKAEFDIHREELAEIRRLASKKTLSQIGFWNLLNEKQTKTAREFLATRSRPDIYLEEDCCGSVDYHFEIRPSGLGDEIHLICKGERVWLDDGLEP